MERLRRSAVGTVKVTVGGVCGCGVLALRVVLGFLGGFRGALGLYVSLGCVSHEALTATLTLSEGTDDSVCILSECFGKFVR